MICTAHIAELKHLSLPRFSLVVHEATESVRAAGDFLFALTPGFGLLLEGQHSSSTKMKLEGMWIVLRKYNYLLQIYIR